MKKILSLIITLFVSAMSVMASPAYRKPFVVKQSDGTELTVLLTGDEALHYHVTVDGKPLVRESNGDYSYATFSDDGYFVSTRQLAHNAELRTSLERELLQSIDDVAMKSKISKAAGLRSAKYRNAAKRAGSQIRPEGEVNVAVLLVEFKDARFAHTKEDINNILNTEGYVYENVIANSIGSARDYFIAQSDGKFKPNFIVTDIVTLDNNMAYYGANDANGNDKKPSYMIKDGIRKADANFDFSICDNNGDGEVEFVYCIYAGYAESYGADENTVWPHQWEMAAECGTVTVDGVKCNTYACSSELILNETYEVIKTANNKMNKIIFNCLIISLYNPTATFKRQPIILVMDKLPAYSFNKNLLSDKSNRKMVSRKLMLAIHINFFFPIIFRTIIHMDCIISPF